MELHKVVTSEQSHYMGSKSKKKFFLLFGSVRKKFYYITNG